MSVKKGYFYHSPINILKENISYRMRRIYKGEEQFGKPKNKKKLKMNYDSILDKRA